VVKSPSKKITNLKNVLDTALINKKNPLKTELVK